MTSYMNNQNLYNANRNDYNTPIWNVASIGTTGEIKAPTQDFSHLFTAKLKKDFTNFQSK